MSHALSRRVNPYASPAPVEALPPTVRQRMESLRRDFENRYWQVLSDMGLTAGFSAAFGSIAWRFSEHPVVTAVAAAVPATVITFESIRDAWSKERSFASDMAKLRTEAQEEWRRNPNAVDL